MRFHHLIFVLISATVFVACATRGELQLTNANIVKLSKLQKQQQADLKALAAKLDRLYKFVLDVRNKTGKSGADLSADLASVQSRIAKLEGRQEELGYQIKQQNDALQALKKTLDDKFALGLTTMPKGFQENQESLYKLAKTALKSDNTLQSRTAARRYIELYPDTKEAPEMQYLIGETFMREKKYGPAIREFQMVHDHYKDATEWNFKALEGIVAALLAQQNCKKAIAVLKYLYRLDRHGPHGKAALKRIKALKQRQCSK